VDTAALDNISFQVADLGGTTLGLATGNTIWLDAAAAGWGWFVDPTPADDSEFNMPGDQGEQNRMELLTVLMHEMGHVFGLEHDDEGVMQETLAAGVRKTPTTAPVAHLFVQGMDADLVQALLDLDNPRPGRRS
jgi:hypothetical protein